MTLEDAKEMHGDAYRPILSTVEYRAPLTPHIISCGLDENKQLRS
jgi:hypothetical protein